VPFFSPNYFPIGDISEKRLIFIKKDLLIFELSNTCASEFQAFFYFASTIMTDYFKN
jgi:hypothetical protein